MGKYLELFRGEVGDLTEKTKLENKPYIAYSTKLGKVTYTVVPVKDPVVEGPADNEIWYTTTDGAIIPLEADSLGDSKVIKNEYKGKIGIITFDKPITDLNGGFLNHYDADFGEFFFYQSLESVILPDSIASLGRNAIGNYVLDDRLALTSITLGLGLSFISTRAFCGCGTLTNIIYKGTISQWNNIVKEENWYVKDHINTTVVHCTDGDVAI